MHGSNHRFIGNEIYHNTGEGITLHDSSYQTRQDNNVIAHNNFHGDGGFQFTNGSNVLVYNNLFWDGSFAWVDGNAKVYNNSFAGSSYIYIGPTSSNVDVRNNLLAGTGPIDDQNGKMALQSHNLLSAGAEVVTPTSSGGSTCKGATCSDRTPATPPDLHLKAGSRAIDAGATLTEVTTDFDGTPRPQGSGYDIGAYEYRATTLLPGDLNKDGKRDLVDVRLLIDMLLNQQPKTPEAELTNDGAVTLADLQTLIKLMVGMP